MNDYRQILKNKKSRIYFSVIGMVCISSLGTKAYAWNEHHTLMPWVLNYQNPNLARTLILPTEDSDQALAKKLIDELMLNPEVKIPLTRLSLRNLGSLEGSLKRDSKVPVQILDLLSGSSVDDPDHGMDQNLPDSIALKVDPQNDRKWMGGTRGFTSQGFRHMFFGGWKVKHPMITFQIPFRPTGQALHRVEILAQKAKELIQSGDLAWGTRVLAWALHYTQDLAQPFHSVELVSLKMVPWLQLAQWPPSYAFEQLRRGTTQIITNFHWAYEGYIFNRIQAPDDPYLRNCLSQPEILTQLKFGTPIQSPYELAVAVSEASVELGSHLGEAELKFFGSELNHTDFDFTVNPNKINYHDYATRASLESPRRALTQVSCTALANASMASRLLIKWAFQP